MDYKNYKKEEYKNMRDLYKLYGAKWYQVLWNEIRMFVYNISHPKEW